MGDSYALTGIHHVHFYVGNVKQAAYYYQKAWGFTAHAYQGLETGERRHTSIVLAQGKIRLLLTSPLGPDGPVNEFLNRHGDGIRDIAFGTDDAKVAFESAVAGGAEAISEPEEASDENGSVVLATIRAYDNVRHTFVQDEGYSGKFLPGYGEYPGPDLCSGSIGLELVDHVVHNMQDGRMEPQVQFYQDALGMKRFWTVDDKDVATEFSSLRSIVVANDNEVVKMPVNEPADGLKKSQIQEFIDFNIDAGVQHVAMLTGDIIATISRLKENGIDFLEVPDTYYADLTDRVGVLDEDIETLRKLRILVDRDEDGYLLQLFTKPIQGRPTFFFEVIQRKGSRSFGKGNFKALFESIELEQAARGNL
ncbi:MAG: 4-hydroxyphenylpyruvate dioxygenase [Candidatus Marinimicrobia bacterium]|nr:4-hydroxyphenylpyruvate dioxygenase [Candidatus Neomarinimicrobiota bacterium]